MERTTKITKLNGRTYRIRNSEKIAKAVEECVIAMSELTIEESKMARIYLDHVMESLYKRSPDTIQDRK